MAERKRKSDDDIASIIGKEIDSAVMWTGGEQADRRKLNIEYYNGVMSELLSQPNRSKVVSHDVRDVMGWMLPGIMRTFTASGTIVEYEATTQEREEQAKQANDYVSHVFMVRNNGYSVLYSAFHDSLLHGDGVIKHWWDDTVDEEVTEHSGIDAEQLMQIVNTPDTEILAGDEEQIMDVDPATGQAVPVMFYSVKVKRIKSKGRLRFRAVAPENFLYNRTSTTIEDARFVGERAMVTKSELLEMGFERRIVDQLTSDPSFELSEEQTLREDSDSAMQYDAPEDASTMVELFECYAKIDIDGDGILENVQVFYAGRGSGGVMLGWEEWSDDFPYSLIPCEPVPHRMAAIGMADHLRDIQEQKSVVKRQMMDNLYAVNNPRPVVEDGTIKNMQSLISPRFGEAILRSKNATMPIDWVQVPFIGDKALLVLQHLDQDIERRTGVSRSTMALDPDALNNQTATAVQERRDAAYSKVELVARNMAEGLRRVFTQSLKLLVKHQDRKEVVKLRGEWATIDPKSWDADMAATVSVGLGSGSRDRDALLLNNVLAVQTAFAEKLAAGGFGVKSVEFLDKIRKTAVQIVESGGIRNADDYFPAFSEEEIQIAKQMALQPPQDPKLQLETKKMEADIQLKAMEAQIKQAELQLKEMEITLEQTRAEKELAMSIEETRQKATIDYQLQTQKLNAEIEKEREQARADMAVQQHKVDSELQLAREQHAFDMQMEREKLEHQKAIDMEKLKIASNAKRRAKFVRGPTGKADSVEISGM
jgi:hypothetical protein